MTIITMSSLKSYISYKLYNVDFSDNINIKIHSLSTALNDGSRKLMISSNIDDSKFKKNTIHLNKIELDAIELQYVRNKKLEELC